MLNLQRIRAISLDLDDTLWPIWPTIDRAEKVLHEWLAINAPNTAALFSSPEALREIRNHVGRERPDLKHDLSALRLESIRLALEQAGDDPLLAEPAFDVFFAERQNVTLFADALPALEFLAARYPLVSLSNGNSDLARMGLDRFFSASVAALDFGVPKPDPRIFHAAAAAAGVQPHEVLHVGDDVLLDVLGARNAGMQAVWNNRVQALWPHPEAPDLEVVSLSELCDALR
ncbi:HAD family hydrolase [uncultured Azohydromonas sp.]|jgi:haloacid dehalogenase superfamily, subfamily IA, variant 3 with third motif having DD or ED/haloacid dehalogenase superfamily, subfamily IA, variant 1 with third motif having Dx(3-4)D or Dx(3-4)E|uniref:HAD family hydrolase n=1 Tax=uncultured Azohydromonas sp. TaxID=487342 RepID=UPI002639A472|nr:HAD family hydrolase [uncultured Azohydromonas sp.]